MVKVNIRFWVTSAGVSPFQKWLKKLDGSSKSTVLVLISKLQNAGEDLQMPTVRWNLFPGLHELRTGKHGGIRIYFCFLDSKTVAILLVGGKKGTQERDIRLAQKRMGDI